MIRNLFLSCARRNRTDAENDILLQSYFALVLNDTPISTRDRTYQLLLFFTMQATVIFQPTLNIDKNDPGDIQISEAMTKILAQKLLKNIADFKFNNYTLWTYLLSPSPNNMILDENFRLVLWSLRSLSVLIHSDMESPVQSKIDAYVDYPILIEVIIRLLDTPFQASKKYVAVPEENYDFSRDIFALLWTLMIRSRSFLELLGNSPKTHIILRSGFKILIESLSDPKQHDQIKLVTSVIQLLSQIREFGISLNQVISVESHAIFSKLLHSVNKLSVVTWTDLLILIMQPIVKPNISMTTILDTHEPFMIILTNVSPTIKKLTQPSSQVFFFKLRDFWTFSAYILLKTFSMLRKIIGDFLYISYTFSIRSYNINLQEIHSSFTK